ncbi:unnamed protein product [Leptosia nina]|uniref:Uncharacterized protein n=1 Tax=Leptosia nina TaxID=320188 RepID=A0AAV1IWV9_9NEOP
MILDKVTFYNSPVARSSKIAADTIMAEPKLAAVVLRLHYDRVALRSAPERGRRYTGRRPSLDDSAEPRTTSALGP